MDEYFEMKMLKKRVEGLEMRIRYIEKRMESEDAKRKADSAVNALISRYGQCVNKTDAASILHVTRTTVYNYIAEGLLETTAHGMVTMESIALCLEGRKRQRKDERYDEADG